ncbi:probable S-adenosylmethionine carrier 2, chloroplastic isoform X2 [Rosa chinensis]|uniref:probable S-adenosylmethionine carrier 2, chloroplastic isoform X2 n=1 Tax=Rosa chinensis TaxID=74649 RepID=UPI001AD906F8|nr:probable S-adenosylmethionine carrier 2, chloroplastic isoform X2 [Rosa chinensis]
MGPLTLAVNLESFTCPLTPKTKMPGFLSFMCSKFLSFMHCGRIGFLFDACGKKFQNVTMAKRKSFASVSMQDDKPFDLLRTLFEGVIAGGTAGVVVETALYPIDTIKTRLQAGALTGVITTPLDVFKTRLMVQYKGIVDCVQTIVREEGPPTLLKESESSPALEDHHRVLAFPPVFHKSDKQLSPSNFDQCCNFCCC